MSYYYNTTFYGKSQSLAEIRNEFLGAKVVSRIIFTSVTLRKKLILIPLNVIRSDMSHSFRHKTSHELFKSNVPEYPKYVNFELSSYYEKLI